MESITYSSLLPLSPFFLEDAIIREQRPREIFLLFLCLALRQREEQISLDRIFFFSILQMFLSPARRQAEVLTEGERGALQMAKNQVRPKNLHCMWKWIPARTASTHPSQTISWLSENSTDGRRWWHLPAHHHQVPQGSRARGSFPKPPSPAEGCCAHCQTVPSSTGLLPTPSGRLGPCKLILTGCWINICYWHWPNEMSVSSTANWSTLICAAD